MLCAARLWDEAKGAATLDAAAARLAWPVLLAGEEAAPDPAHPGAAAARHARPLGRLSPAALADWYGRAAIYALPARYEPFGLSVLEAALAGCALVLAGYLPNHRVPDAFARHRVTVHVPRAPYARALPGIPTIRPFEALACGIPLVSAPWDDAEGLFAPGEDFLVARTGEEMQARLTAVLADPGLAAALRARGLAAIRARHTCAHRVDELLDVYGRVAGGASARAAGAGRRA